MQRGQATNILCVDLYSWVGEEEGYDGCLVTKSRTMQRGPVKLILCVDLYSWVGEEEGYDGCVTILSRPMQRCPATLQRQRSRPRGEGCTVIQQGTGRGEGTQEEEGGHRW